MQERSIIVVSKNQATTSKILFTLRMLVAPFQWYHAFIVSVPTNLIDIVEAPFPIMVGVSYDLYKDIEPGLDDIETSCAWVFPDIKDLRIYNDVDS